MWWSVVVDFQVPKIVAKGDQRENTVPRVAALFIVEFLQKEEQTLAFQFPSFFFYALHKFEASVRYNSCNVSAGIEESGSFTIDICISCHECTLSCKSKFLGYLNHNRLVSFIISYIIQDLLIFTQARFQYTELRRLDSSHTDDNRYEATEQK
jgi:ferredoxin